MSGPKALNKALIETLQADFAKHGKRTLEALRDDNPGRYLALAARLLPKPQVEKEDLYVFMSEMASGESGQRLLDIRDTLFAIAKIIAGVQPGAEIACMTKVAEIVTGALERDDEMRAEEARSGKLKIICKHPMVT